MTISTSNNRWLFNKLRFISEKPTYEELFRKYTPHLIEIRDVKSIRPEVRITDHSAKGEDPKEEAMKPDDGFGRPTPVVKSTLSVPGRVLASVQHGDPAVDHDEDTAPYRPMKRDTMRAPHVDYDEATAVDDLTDLSFTNWVRENVREIRFPGFYVVGGIVGQPDGGFDYEFVRRATEAEERSETLCPPEGEPGGRRGSFLGPQAPLKDEEDDADTGDYDEAMMAKPGRCFVEVRVDDEDSDDLPLPGISFEVVDYDADTGADGMTDTNDYLDALIRGNVGGMSALGHYVVGGVVGTKDADGLITWRHTYVRPATEAEIASRSLAKDETVARFPVGGSMDDLRAGLKALLEAHGLELVEGQE